MRSPVFWLAVAYAAGLALFHQVDDSPQTLFLLAVLTLLVALAALRRRWLRATLVSALAGFFLVGGATSGLVAAAVPDNRLDRVLAAEPIDLSEAVRLTGWLRRAPQKTRFATVYELELERVEQGAHQSDVSGGVRLSYFGLLERDLPPEPVPQLRYGDRVEALVRVHPPVRHQTAGSFDWQEYLAHRGIFLEGSLKSTRLLRKLPGRRGNPVFARVQDLRTRLLAQLDLLVPPSLRRDHNAVLRAMLLGDRGFLSPRLKQQFRRSGAYHVLVVSGLHVGMIALFVFWLVRRLIRNEWATAIVTIAALVFYLLLVEDRPPIERAVWMVSLYLMARLLFRQVHLANSVALAALVVLFLHPLWLFESSFHLSFGAAFLIAFFALPWRERTSAPYRDALGFLDAAERDDQLRPPRLAQFRLDLRLLSAALAERLFWTQSKERAAHRLLTGTVRLGLTVWDFFLISFAIHLGFVLMTAFYFKRVVWAGLLTNLLVVPLVGWIVPLGLTGLLLSLLWLPAGALLAELASTLTGGLLWLVDAIHGRGLSYGIPPPPVWLVLLYAAALALLGVAVARQRLQRWAGVGLAVLLLVVVTFPFPPRIPGRVLEVTVLDVGQGDSLFLTFPNGEAWLLDAGRGPVEIQPGYATGEAIGETVVVPYLRARGVKRLDRVWLSHAHLDHMGGLPAVLEEFSVGDFHVGRTPPSLRYQELLRKISEHNIPLKTHAAGERFAVGEVHVEVLWPGADYQPGAEPSNNDSLVLRLCLPAQAGRTDTCILLPGDIEAEVEQKLAQGEATLAAAVLKVPHHGGHHAASSEFLAAVSPRVAVISVGAYNRFAHPYPAVIERLATRARRIYRTDRDGSVTVRLDGGELRVETHRQQQRRETYPNFWAKLAACARRLAPVELF